MPGRSQGLAEQQMAMSASMSTSQHTTSVLAYQQRYESNGAGGAARPFDISDPEGNTMTLLRNVESVYVQSMTTEDEKNKMMREKIYADDQNRKMREDIEKLSTQLSEERHRRTNEHSVRADRSRARCRCHSIPTCVGSGAAKSRMRRRELSAVCLPALPCTVDAGNDQEWGHDDRRAVQPEPYQGATVLSVHATRATRREAGTWLTQCVCACGLARPQKMHDDEFVVVRDVQESSAKRGAVLSRLMREVDRIKAKQVDRKVLKQHKHTLGLKSQDLQVWSAERPARAACSDLSQG